MHGQIQQLTQLVHNSVSAISAPPKKPTGPGTERRGRPDRRGTSPGRASSRSPSAGRRNMVVGWGKKCYHCGSEDHSKQECKSFKKMMEDANKDKKPGEKWSPPPGYKSALGKARDAQKAAAAKDRKTKPVKSMAPVAAEDTASDSDSDSDVSLGSRHGVDAMRPRFVTVKKGLPAHRALARLPIETTESGTAYGSDYGSQPPGHWE